MATTADLSQKHQIVVNYYLRGYTKRAAMTKAGYSKNTEIESVFGRPDVIEVIRYRQEAAAASADLDRDFLLRKLKQIIAAEPGELLEIDENGRPSINWDRMSPALRGALKKVKATTQKGKGKYGKNRTHVEVELPDVIAAIREAATLLGIRQESLKIEAEMDQVQLLQAGLAQIKREADGSSEDTHEDAGAERAPDHEVLED